MRLRVAFKIWKAIPTRGDSFRKSTRTAAIARIDRYTGNDPWLMVPLTPRELEAFQDAANWGAMAE